MATTVVKTIGSTGTFSTLQLWEDGAPVNLVTAEKSAAGTFSVAAFTQGESLTFVGSSATGKFLDTDSTGVGTGSYVVYSLITGNPAASDVVTGGTSGATCILSSSTPMDTGVIWQGQFQMQEFSGATVLLTITGSTTSSTAYKELTTVAGASFRDDASVQTNAMRYNSANGCGIINTGDSNNTVTSQENNSRVSNLQIANTFANGIAFRGSGSGQIFDNLLIEGARTSSSTSIATISIVANNILRNSLIVQRGTGATQIISTGTGSPFLYNCTIVAPDDLATAPTSIFNSGASGTVTVQNCGLFAGDSTKAIVAGSATFNFTTCYSDISGTSGVTQTIYSGEFQNVNNATRDYRLVTGAAQKDTGTTDAINAANDIAGTARPSGAAYDVGCWEFVAAGGGISIPVLMAQYRNRWS